MKDQNYINILISQLELRDEIFQNSQEMMEKAVAVGKIKADYEKSHPESVNEENRMEAEIQYLGDRIRRRFESLDPFNGNPEEIPEIPLLPVYFLKEKVWPGLIRAGAIPKKELIPGKKYKGSCRNASEATWDGKVFWYTRYKFGEKYQEQINHFQDDDGSDVFIPIRDE